MNCPYCGNEMIHGMIHIDSNGTFFEQRFVSDNDNPVKEKRQIMKRVLGYKEVYFQFGGIAPFKGYAVFSCLLASFCSVCGSVGK